VPKAEAPAAAPKTNLQDVAPALPEIQLPPAPRVALPPVELPKTGVPAVDDVTGGLQNVLP
jgi:hypothetical protein